MSFTDFLLGTFIIYTLIRKPKEYAHLLVCMDCDREYLDVRNGKMYLRPDRYRCKVCGGELELKY